MELQFTVETLKITEHGLVGVSRLQRERTGRDYFFDVEPNSVDFDDEGEGVVATWYSEDTLIVVYARHIVG